MLEHPYAKSPPQPKSKKTYDYLIEQQTSNQKFTNRQQIAPQLSPYSKQQTEYELIVQFQLRRQKQKTIILQERLRNKQSFIKQMKEFQDQLTIAFQKCQQELHFYKIQCQDYESKYNSFVTFNNGTLPLNNDISLGGNDVLTSQGQQQIIREYVQQIAELKHLVIRLEEQINLHQKKQKQNSYQKNLASSVRHNFYPDNVNNFKLKASSKNIQRSPLKNRQQKSSHSEFQKKQRSKTLANEFVQEKRSQNFTAQSKISQFVKQQNRKISSFISHFLTMCEFFQQSIEKQLQIKHKLKKAWKWIKSTLVQWNYLKTQRIQKVKEYKIGNIVTKLLPIGNLSISQIETILQQILKRPGQHGFKKQ